MQRTRINDRVLPRYSVGEEIFNMVSHIVGAGFGVLALVSCILVSAVNHNVWGIIGSSIYGISLIVLYTMSSVYHGLRPSRAKKIMQVMDHCTIYGLIAGTYTPILFCSIRKVSPVWCWVIFGFVWGVAALGIVLNAIDLRKFRVISVICYLVMGWCIIFAFSTLMESMERNGIIWLVLGGIFYTLGSILYGLGRKIPYMHSVFHIFTVLGSVAQFICIIKYVL